MLSANADLQVLGYLGRALSLELSAVQMYSTQAKLVEAWGLSEMADEFANEAKEEMAHVDRIIARMLALGAAPNASQLRPVKLGPNIQTLLQHNYVFETELMGLYDTAARYCARIGDHDSRLFFEKLYAEESEHAAHMTKQLAQLQSGTVPAGATL